MRSSQRPMTTVTSNEAEQEFQRLLRQVAQGKTRALIEEDGKAVAAIISAADLEQLEKSEAQRQEDFQVFDEISQAFADEPLDKIEREVSKAVRDVRAEKRRRQSTTSSKTL